MAKRELLDGFGHGSPEKPMTPKSSITKVLQDNTRSLTQGIYARFLVACDESHIGIVLEERWGDENKDFCEAPICNGDDGLLVGVS